jgi:hypothetical protein
MAKVEASLDQSLDDASISIRRVAAKHGYALYEGHEIPNTLIFRKGVRILSWGSSLTVTLHVQLPGLTQVTIVSSEVFALTDWGRGHRAAERLLDGVGAEIL